MHLYPVFYVITMLVYWTVISNLVIESLHFVGLKIIVSKKKACQQLSDKKNKMFCVRCNCNGQVMHGALLVRCWEISTLDSCYLLCLVSVTIRRVFTMGSAFQKRYFHASGKQGKRCKRSLCCLCVVFERAENRI